MSPCAPDSDLRNLLAYATESLLKFVLQVRELSLEIIKYDALKTSRTKPHPLFLVWIQRKSGHGIFSVRGKGPEVVAVSLIKF